MNNSPFFQSLATTNLPPNPFPSTIGLPVNIPSLPSSLYSPPVVLLPQASKFSL